MKIGIITFTEGFNFGCKLQNYALLRTLEKIAPDAEVVTINNATCCGNNKLSRVKHRFKLLITNNKLYRNERHKQRVFDEYNEKYLKMTKSIVSNKNISDITDIDYYICGSDQIWNPNYVPNIEINTAYNSTGAKRIAYAASLGIKVIPDNRKEEYKKTIGSMDAVSVREEEASFYLKSLLNRDVEVTLDPTLLLNASDWTSFEHRPSFCPENYILTYFLTGVDKNNKEFIYEYARTKGLMVIALNDSNLPDWFAISPNEFIYLIHHCSYFFTDSFHGTVFSIIFHKDFYTFPRYSVKESQRQGGRITTLLNVVGLENRFIERLELKSIDNIDYSGVDARLKNGKQSSLKFLQNSLRQNSKSLHTEHNNCTGCGACSIVCPVQAISMVEMDGFFYPVVSSDKCINCGKCNNVCNQINRIETEKSDNEEHAFCMESNNDAIRLKSSSGGVFYELAKKIIDEGGVVFSPVFDDKFILKHRAFCDLAELEKELGSKYVQSNAWDSFAEVKTLLENGRKVLFSGTPCQTAGLKLYLGKEYDNLLTQDLICHGVPSNVLFQRYVDYLQEKNGKRLIKYSFRNKDHGWYPFNVKYTFEDGEEVIEPARQNEFYGLFIANYTLRPSCFENCVCRKGGRKSDITLADYWGAANHDNMGTSLAIIHTEKGARYVDQMKCSLKRYCEVDLSDAIRKNPAYYSDIKKPYDYKMFEKDKRNFGELYKEYYSGSFIKKIRRKVVRMTGKNE